MAELLLELRSEEIPARMQADAALRLGRAVGDKLVELGLSRSETIGCWVTPRRLVLHVNDVAQGTAPRSIERRGPRTDAPARAYEGFIRSLGTSAYVLDQQDDKKGQVWVARIEQPGEAASGLLATILPDILAAFPWPKSMRWGSGEVRWVRPLQSILCLLDGEVVPFRFGDIASGRATIGHRFLAPEPFAVTGFDDYRSKLLAAKVVLDPAERRQRIETGARALAERRGLRLRPDPALLDEVTGLVEWPVSLLGRIDAEFMDIPAEVLRLTMRQNQKYLALETADGRLADRFVVVANTEAADGGAAIVAGNERVLRARFWDARHFWNLDRKQPLEAGLPRLERTVFHAELGTQGERVQRLVALTGELVPFVPGADRALAERAALLAKADLVSGMVGEFPELQGVMGGHYARAQGEPEAVATAIAEHYAPRGPDDRCPTAPDSVAVALADKLDSLAGFFAKGIKPTGSKDPFALRRAGLGVIRLVLENGLRLPLRRVLAGAAALYPGQAGGDPADLLAFFADRLKVHLRERGVRHDLVTAVFAMGDDDLVRVLARVEALQAFVGSKDGQDLLVAFRRASNILAIEEKRDGRAYGTADVDPDRLRLPEERNLLGSFDRAQGEIKKALLDEDFATAMRSLASLRPVVDAFFDKVLVNDPEPDLRRARLGLLCEIRDALGSVADFTVIEDAPAGS